MEVIVGQRLDSLYTVRGVYYGRWMGTQQEPQYITIEPVLASDLKVAMEKLKKQALEKKIEILGMILQIEREDRLLDEKGSIWYKHEVEYEVNGVISEECLGFEPRDILYHLAFKS